MNNTTRIALSQRYIPGRCLLPGHIMYEALATSVRFHHLWYLSQRRDIQTPRSVKSQMPLQTGIIRKLFATDATFVLLGVVLNVLD